MLCCMRFQCFSYVFLCCSYALLYVFNVFSMCFSFSFVRLVFFLCVSNVLLMLCLCFPYTWLPCVSYAIPLFSVARRTSIKDHPVYGTGHSLAFPVFRCFSYAFRMFYYMSLVCPLFAYANTFSDIWFRVSLKIKGYRCSKFHMMFHNLGFGWQLTNYKFIISATRSMHKSIQMITASFNKQCKVPL